MRRVSTLLRTLAVLGFLKCEARAVANGTFPSTAVLTIESPASLGGNFVGLFATFSGTPRSGDLVVVVPEGDPEGCSGYPKPPERPVEGQATIAVVRRGTCTFAEKARLAQKAGAAGVVIVSDTEAAQLMGTGNSTSKDLGVEIFVVSVQKSVGDKILSWQGEHGASEAAVLSVSVYEPRLVDLSELLVICLGTSLVVAGAFFSTADLRVGSPIAAPAEEVVEVSGEYAIGFFVLGSCMLMLLFFFMRFLIYVIIFGFCMGGGSCIVELGSSCLKYLYPSLRNKEVSVPFFGPVAHTEFMSAVPAAVVVGSWLFFRNTENGWFFQDIIGAGFLCMVQRTLRLPNMKIATMLLVLMFFFDIFWVFISPLLFQKSVMVTVATGGDTGESVPMLLRVPAIGDAFGRDRMLGFGDIVLPGLLVSYLRRHDILSKKRFWSGYFVLSVVGYFLGLCATIAALVLMQKGQPALLYLVPGTLGTTVALAACRGELARLWQGTPTVSARAEGIEDQGLTLQERP